MPRLWTCAFLLLLSATCTRSDREARFPAVSVTGDWSGTWISDNGIDAGTFDLSLAQVVAAVLGGGGLTASPCVSAVTVNATVAGFQLTGSLRDGGVEIPFQVTISGQNSDTLDGTYGPASGGACDGDTGTLSGVRALPLTAPAAAPGPWARLPAFVFAPLPVSPPAAR